ncbi:MAG: saccharopine dehydrogenase C-terminal domain-containing protein [Pseudomonadota bacterium]
MEFERIAVLGLGRVGTLAALLLHEAGFDVVGLDTHQPREGQPYRFQTADLADLQALEMTLKSFEGVLSCLPYHLNAGVAAAAHRLGIHYFDLTEDVPTTKAILQMSQTAKGAIVPQCGLAPGFIGIVGAWLETLFDSTRSLRMRTGALPRNPTGLLGYAFNWSHEGVVNEYLNDCEIIENGEKKWVSPMEWLELLIIDGVKYEAATTSGGLGTMCETYLGRVENLDYKSIRYPGHFQQMNFFFHELLMREDREQAGKILTHAKPPTDDDVVLVHASAEGVIDGELRRKEFVRSYRPKIINDRSWTAIAWTTSASVAAVIEMVGTGKLPRSGFIRQEEIPLDAFLATRNGSLYRPSAG